MSSLVGKDIELNAVGSELFNFNPTSALPQDHDRFACWWHPSNCGVTWVLGCCSQIVVVIKAAAVKTLLLNSYTQAKKIIETLIFEYIF